MRRGEVSTMGFDRVSVRVIVSDTYLHDKPEPNNLKCGRAGGGGSRGGGGRCTY